MSNDNVLALIKAIQTSGGITLQNEAQLTVAFQKAGEKTPDQVLLETGVFTPKQVTGLCKALDLMNQNRITPMEVSTCMATMLGSFSSLDEALKEIEVMARPEGQIAEPDPIYKIEEPQFASGQYQQQYESGQYEQQYESTPQFESGQYQQQPQYEAPPQQAPLQYQQPAAAPSKSLPVVINLLLSARIITQDQLDAFVQHMNAAPQIPWQQHALTLGLTNQPILDSAIIGQRMIDSGEIDEAKFNVCMYDQITGSCSFLESLQARGWM